MELANGQVRQPVYYDGVVTSTIQPQLPNDHLAAEHLMILSAYTTYKLTSRFLQVTYQSLYVCLVAQPQSRFEL